MKYSIAYQQKYHTRRLVAIVLACLFLFIITAVVIQWDYHMNLQPLSNSRNVVSFTIPTNSTAKEVAVALKQHNVIKSAWAFEWYIRSNELNDKLIAGTYNLMPSESIPQIAKYVTQGIHQAYVTILPGQRLDQIRTKLIHTYGFSASAVDAAFNPKLYVGNPALADKPPSASLEGYLYPNSYGRDSSTTPEDIIRESLSEMSQHLTPAIRQGFIRDGLTIHQGITLASIVEQEVSNTTDRAKVAQVFLKRLKLGMPLGSDVTAYYGSIIAGKTPSLTYNSPYNTLLHTGLPPGPISTVSSSSLRAVAFPAKTNYLYFVSGDNGVTYFSNTLKQHEALTKQYCKKLCAQ